ncbi:MAG: ribonuclease HII [Candidatus Pacebacteria bacterium]|nr:ribonuclease HII [Candidatus Paceibacterota bacterium]
MNKKWLIGIDEAGRGPLAGPVSVGVVKIPTDFDWSLIPGVNDSKKISEKKRDAVFELTNELVKQGLLSYSVKLVSANSIDNKGIVSAIKRAIESAIEELKLNPEECFIKLDGSLHAPEKFEQETIIKGDGKEKVIGLASIMAKVKRDTYMKEIAEQYPEYGLEGHKGYGTKAHREAIAKFGLTIIHRRTYCKNIKML